MRPPEPGLGEAVVSLIDREPVSLDRATHQWESLRGVLIAAGWDITDVAREDGDPPCPDGAFVGDAVTSVAGQVILARSSMESRRRERVAIRRALAAAHVRVAPILRPGTVEGGDLVRVGDVLYVGVGTRTNRAGVAQVANLVEPRGLTVVTVPLHKSVQLDAGVTPLPCGTVLGYPPLVDDPSVFDVFVPVPEPGGAQALWIGDRTVLISAAAPRSAKTLVALGYEPVPVDISEFEKREGTMSCLVAPF